ncbi:hypothetical protein DY240_16755 [Jiangella rhizosphaerae]|uniref:Uncharacterized protein n=1 Tax=Jiangella rhizosphaerae TaxID=2293569 RepID=A0A418KNV8_9ACTN|nr:hypothetical protein DY240_16755 [Jiangella rhizosphaerae]
MGVALLLPGFGPAAPGELDVAGAGDGPAAVEVPAETATAPPDSEVPSAEPTDVPTSDDPFGFPLTRQLLLDTAVEHLDPAHEHLPAETSNRQGGGNGTAASVGTKLGWTIPGADGEGMVQVAVTEAGYVEGEYAFESFAGTFGCVSREVCTEQPGPDGTVYVAEADAETGMALGIVYERADGSLVGIAVNALFGNNSVTPVSNVDITVDQAIAFVTDPDLQVAPPEAADDYEDPAQRIIDEAVTATEGAAAGPAE